MLEESHHRMTSSSHKGIRGNHGEVPTAHVRFPEKKKRKRKDKGDLWKSLVNSILVKCVLNILENKIV